MLFLVTFPALSFKRLKSEPAGASSVFELKIPFSACATEGADAGDKGLPSSSFARTVVFLAPQFLQV